MHDFNFINYSKFFNEKIKGWQILADRYNKSIELNKYRNIIVKKLLIKTDNLAVPIQVHSNNVKFTNKSGTFDDTDGLVTEDPELILSLQTADCLPIFLFDKLNHIRGLIHAGWRGTKNKIVENALKIMLMKGSTLSDIIVVIGASIHKCCYEIGEELVPFFDENCIYSIDGKKYLSLQEQTLQNLSKIGILKNNIHINERCTFMDINLSSYRRDKDSSGRMLSFMGNF